MDIYIDKKQGAAQHNSLEADVYDLDIEIKEQSVDTNPKQQTQTTNVSCNQLCSRVCGTHNCPPTSIRC